MLVTFDNADFEGKATQKNRQVPFNLLMTELKKTVSITTVATTAFANSFSSYIVLIFLDLYKSLSYWVLMATRLVNSTEIIFELTRLRNTGVSIMIKYL